MSEYIKGNKYPNSKPSKTYSSGRVCKNNNCDTLISKYNKYSWCNKHKLKTFPRIKGRNAPTDLQEPIN